MAFIRILNGITVGVAVALAWSAGSAAAATGTSGTAQFQRSEDTPSPGPHGTLILQHTDKQVFSVDVRNLPDNSGSFGLYWFTADAAGFIDAVGFIAPLNLKTNGHWTLRFEGTPNAPSQITNTIPGVTNLEDLALQNVWIFIFGPENTNVTGCVTNFTGCTTNVSGDVTNLVGCVTNITGCVTNTPLVLSAEAPRLVSSPEAVKGRLVMYQPSIPIDLRAKGTVRSKFVERTGASLLNIRARGLTHGQDYSLWFCADSPCAETDFFWLADMDQSSPLSSSASFRRDTSRGEQLPFAVPAVTDLSGLAFEIRDSFGAVHLQGTIP
jgi:hypothetical protein